MLCCKTRSAGHSTHLTHTQSFLIATRECRANTMDDMWLEGGVVFGIFGLFPLVAGKPVSVHFNNFAFGFFCI